MKEQKTLTEKLGRLIELAGTAILMNLLFVVSCLPIVTIGQAWCGLVTAIRYNIRGDSWFQGYKDGFKKRFLRGTIVWCVMLVLQVFFFLTLLRDTQNLFLETGALNKAGIVPAVVTGLMYLLFNMLTVSLIMLNVYIPTKVGDWLSNAAGMVFKAPLQLFGCALLYCLPLVMSLYMTDIFFMIGIVFVGFYYALAALVITMLLKDTLVDYLVDARIDGTLIADEGKPTPREDDEEDEEDS